MCNLHKSIRRRKAPPNALSSPGRVGGAAAKLPKGTDLKPPLFGVMAYGPFGTAMKTRMVKGFKNSSTFRDVASFSLFVIALSIAYGIAHDMVTAHVAVEYFTVYHPHIVDSKSPIIMALLWGVIATWWVGLLAGLLLAISNVIGKEAPLPWRTLRIRAVVGMAILWVSAMMLLAGVYVFAGQIPMKERRPTFEQDRRLIAVGVAHGWSYTGSVLVVIILATWIHRARSRASLNGASNSEPGT